MSKKGGVGKSTTAVNLAAALALAGRRTLLIDLDSQASASVSLGVPRHLLAPSTADVLLRDMPAWRAVRATSLPNLHLLTASADLHGVESELRRKPDPASRLQRALIDLTPDYEATLIDCPATMSLITSNALVAADSFVLPVVPHYLALEGVHNLLEAVRRTRTRYGSSARLAGILLTMVDYRTNACRENVARLRNLYGDRVFAVEVRTNVRLAEAPERGLTIFEYDARSSGARAYQLLSQEFLWRTAADGQPEVQPGPGPRRAEAYRFMRSSVSGLRH
ncbi:MAG: ParA family protein [Thermoanaerobaculia bacterium]